MLRLLIPLLLATFSALSPGVLADTTPAALPDAASWQARAHVGPPLMAIGFAPVELPGAVTRGARQ